MTDWYAGTFDGATRSTAHDVARATPEQRLHWLAAAQRLAAGTGALQTELDRRADAQLAQWRRTSPSPAHPEAMP